MGVKEVLAGKAVVEVGTRLAIQRGLRMAEDHFRKFGGTVTKIGGAVALGGASAIGGATSIVAPLLKAAVDFAGFGSTLDDMSQRTGIAAGRLSELAYAAKQSGTDLETVETGVKKTQHAIVGAIEGNKAAAESFRQLGLDVNELQYMAGDDQFYAVARAIASIPDPTLRASRALDLFGKSGTQLLPLMISDIDALRNEARELGITMTTEDATAAAVLGDALDKAADVAHGAWMKLGAAIAPMLTQAIELGVGIVAVVSKWIDRNRGLVVGLVTAALSIAGIGAGLVLAGTSLAVFGGAVTLVGTAIGFLSVVVGYLTAPMLTVVGLLAGAGIAAYIFRDRLIAALTPLVPVFMPVLNAVRELGTIFGQTFGGIVSALSSGSLEDAGAVAMAGLTAAFWTGVAGIGNAMTTLMDLLTGWLPGLDSVRNYATQTFAAIGQAILAGRWDIAGQIAMLKLRIAIGDGLDVINAVWNAAMTGLGAAWDFLVYGLSRGWATIVAVWDTAVNTLTNMLTGLVQAVDYLVTSLKVLALQAAAALGDDGATGAIAKERQAYETRTANRKPDIAGQNAATKRDYDARIAAQNAALEKSLIGRVQKEQAADNARRDRRAAQARELAALEGQASAAFTEAGAPTLDARAAEARKALAAAVKDLDKPNENKPEVAKLGEAIGGAQKEMKLSSVGTFSAAAASMLGGGDAGERVAANTARTNTLLQRMVKQRQRGPTYD